MPYREKKQGVYRIINLATNESYIGSSSHMMRRKASHFSFLRKGTHPNRKLQKAYNEGNAFNFVFEILEEVKEKEVLRDREQYFINYFDSVNKGYNILESAKSPMGHTYPEEIRKIFSHSRMGAKNHMWGKHLSDEHKQKISNSNRGRKRTFDSLYNTRASHFKPIKNLDTGEMYNYIGEAAKAIGVCQHAISNALRGKSKTCGGFHWAYIENK